MTSTISKDFINLQLTKEEAQHIMSALIRTSASGKDLDVSEELEEHLLKITNGDNPRI